MTARGEVDIVVCVHNAIEDVRACLASLLSTWTDRTRLILVDDASCEEVAALLRTFTTAHPAVTLVREESNVGYVRAANKALRLTTAPYVLLLNSDTVVSRGWVRRMLTACAEDPSCGLVGPLSNAGGWQSVPELFDDATGDWMVNALPPGCDVENMAQLIADLAAKPARPRVQLLNGFCMMVRRSALDSVGLLDEVHFPWSFGVEHDYCLRAVKAGWHLVVADDAYVLHAKSRSYGNSTRRAAAPEARRVLRQLHGNAYDQAKEDMRANEAMATIRERVRHALSTLPRVDTGRRA